jgi:hypothetical protein
MGDGLLCEELNERLAFIETARAEREVSFLCRAQSRKLVVAVIYICAKICRFFSK